MPLHLRLVLANGLVFALGVLAMSLAPTDERGPTALAVLVGGGAAIVAVNTRHLRRSMAPLVTTIGALRSRWENEHRAQTARSVASREYDGQRMAMDIHNNVGDKLAAALVALNQAIHHAPPDVAAELEAVRHNTRTGLVEMRRISRRLRPEMLEDLGLQSALGVLATNLGARRPGTEIHRHIEGAFPTIGEEAELVVFRVAEEAIHNIARHARAKHVDLYLRREGDLVVLRVTDDGVGVGHSGERTGILSMRERAALVGGRLSVTSRPGGGTEVRLDVPAEPVTAT